VSRAVAVVAIMLVTGCDLVLGLEPRTRTCPGAGIADELDRAPPCAPWGRATEGNATVAIADGELVVTLGTGAAAQGSCTAFLATAVSPDGATLEIAQASTAASAFIQFVLIPEDRAEVTAELRVARDATHLVNSGVGIVTSMPVDGAAVRRLRLRPDPDGAGMRGELSTDGETWTTVGTVPGAPATSAFVAFTAATSAAEPTATTTAFERVRFCAP